MKPAEDPRRSHRAAPRDGSTTRLTGRQNSYANAERCSQADDGSGLRLAPATNSAAGNGADGAPPGFDIKKGGLGSPAQAIALATLCAVLFLTFLDNTVVSVGLANVQSDLHAGVTSLQWVVNGYALTFASFMLAAGMLGDLLGRKRIMLAGVARVLRRVGGGGAGLQRRLADRRARRHGHRGRGQRARDPLDHPPRVPGPRDPGRCARRLGRGLGPRPRPRAGHRRGLGGILELAGDLLVQPGLRSGRLRHGAVAVPETADRQGRRIDVPGFFFGAAFLGCMSFAVIQGEQSGLHQRWIVALFVLCGLSGVAFVITEHRVKSPMLELSLFRRPPFSGSNFVAFAAYFGTFSIFFFTALYLQVVADASAYQTAVDFLPMAAGLIIASALTGPLVARIGPRWPDDDRLPPGRRRHPDRERGARPHLGFATLGWVLPIAGIGIGMLLVPVTSVPLTVVPPERSGMAASATNTSREMGAVFGVAILGAIVNAKLTGDLAARLKAIGIPPSFQSLVEHAIQTGRRMSGGAASSAEHSKNAAVARSRRRSSMPRYDAFGSGLHEALLLSGCLILVGAAVAVLHHPPLAWRDLRALTAPVQRDLASRAGRPSRTRRRRRPAPDGDQPLGVSPGVLGGARVPPRPPAATSSAP